MIPTVKLEWGVERAYCFRRCRRAGAPKDEDVVGNGARCEGFVGNCPGAVVVDGIKGTADWDRFWR